MRRYKVELSFLIDEDEIRNDEEVKELLKELFNDSNYKFWHSKVIENECKHEDWKRGNCIVIDPDGWYYNQPCYEVKYICSKCGKIKYVKE